MAEAFRAGIGLLHQISRTRKGIGRQPTLLIWCKTAPYWRIVTRAAKSPVRTVTRKEVVPGVYGAVVVQEGNLINVAYMRTASDLTAAIATLTEIRDAMDNT